MSNGLTADNIIRTLPTALQADDSIYALAIAVAEALSARTSEIDGIRIYSRIDELPEGLLDILAHDFKVDWYDPTYLTLAEKRKTLKDSWNVHRALGTKSAVEKAISAIYSDTEVAEWFDYGGLPYHFKLLIDATYENIDPVKHARVLDRVEYYKNLRSVLDGVEYTASPSGYCRTYGAAAASGIEINITTEVAVYGVG